MSIREVRHRRRVSGARSLSFVAMAAVAALGSQAAAQYAPGETVTTFIPNSGLTNWYSSGLWNNGVPNNTATLPGIGPGSLSYVAQVDFDSSIYGTQNLNLDQNATIDLLDLQSGAINLNLGANTLSLVYPYSGGSEYGQASVYVGDGDSSGAIANPLASLTVSNGNINSSDIHIGDNGTAGALDITGSNTVWNTYNGYDPALNPPLNGVTPPAGSNINSGGLFMGTGGDATLTVEQGATLHFNLGPSSLNYPYPYLTTGGTWNGNATNTTINVLSGGQFISDGFFVMGVNGGYGTQVHVNGTNSLFSDNGQIWLGVGASTETDVTVDGGGTFNTTQLANAPYSEVTVGQSSTAVLTIGTAANGAGTWTGGDAYVGDSATGTVNVTNGSGVSLNYLQIADNPGATGYFNINTGAVVNINDAIVGFGGTGNLTVDTGGQLFVNDPSNYQNLVIGASQLTGSDPSTYGTNQGTGYVNVNDNAVLNVAGQVSVGLGGNGYLHLNTGPDGGPTVTLESLNIGDAVDFNVQDAGSSEIYAGGYGEVDLSAGTSMAVNGQINVGNSWLGTLNVNDASVYAQSVSIGNSQNPGTGNIYDGLGTVNVTGDDFIPALLDVTGGQIVIGNNTFSPSPSALNVTGAVMPSDAQVNAGSIVVGNLAGSNGQLNVSEGTLNVSSYIYVGEQGTGSFTLSNGSVASNQGGGTFDLVIGDFGSGSGTVTTGATAVVGDLLVANNQGSSGTLYIGDTGGLNLGTQLSSTNYAVIGNMGAANLTIQNAALIEDNWMTIGSSGWYNSSDSIGTPVTAAGTANVTISGGLPAANVALNVGGLVTVGYGGTGTVTQLDAGDGAGASWVQVEGLTLGRTAEFQGTDFNNNLYNFDLAGTGTWNVTNGSELDVLGTSGDGLFVGYSSTGTLNIHNGTVNAPFVTLGSEETGPYTGTTFTGNGLLTLEGSAASPATLNVNQYGLDVGQYGTGVVTLIGDDTNAGAVINVNNVTLGDQPGSTGSMTLTNATVNAETGVYNGFTNIGSSGNGHLYVDAGSVYVTGSITAGAHLGSNNDGTANLVVDASTLTADGFISLGRGGQATAFIQNGSTVTTQTLAMGEDEFDTVDYPAANGVGSLTVIDSTLNVDALGSSGPGGGGFVGVGREGQAYLYLTNGSTMTVGDASIASAADYTSFSLGGGAGSYGYLGVLDTQAGSGLTPARSYLNLQAADLIVGSAGGAQADVNGSSVNIYSQVDPTSPTNANVGGNLEVGQLVGGSGTINLTNLAWLFAQQNGFVGDAGTGALNISSGSSANFAGNLTVGNQVTGGMASTGAVTLHDAGSSLNVQGNVYNGPAGTGTIDLEDTGTNMTVNGTFYNGASGTLKGKGALTVGSGLVNDGLIEPGGSPGVLTVAGDFTNNSDGLLNILIDGTTLGTGYSQLDVSGKATLDGTLAVTLGPDYTFAPGQTFWVMLFGSSSGTFATDTINGTPIADTSYSLLYTSGGIELKTQAVPEPGSFLACGVGLAALLLRRKRKNS